MSTQQIPAGLGKIYFCRVEDLEKNPDTPMQLLGDAVKIEPEMLANKDDGRQPSYSPKGFSITGKAVVDGPISEQVKELLKDPTLVDVTLNREPGRMPRKMKKAYRSDYPQNTKWKRKVANYLRRRLIVLHDVEMVATVAQ